MSTIKDVARLAGVAPSTVSHYFTGNAPVKRETRARIAEAVASLDYRPNVVARSLRLNCTQTIGLIVPEIANPFFAEIVQAIGYACQQKDYSLLLADSGNDANRESILLDNMLKQHIDGLLVIHSGNVEDDHLLYGGHSKPMVFVDRSVPGRPSVATDNYAGGRMAARHLVQLGHRHFGIIAGNSHVQNVQERLAGFQDELAAQALQVARHNIIHGSQTFETGRSIRRLLAMPTPPTAVFATNDIIAVGAWHELNDMSLHVPDDVSLVGYDNIDMSQWTIPPLTTVMQDKQEMGKLAVTTLIQGIQTKVMSSETAYIIPQLVVRASTAPVLPNRLMVNNL